MAATIQALMNTNLIEVFGERDPQRRRAAIERTYTPDVVFLDPDEIVEGWDALDAKVQKLLDGAPDFVFSPAGPVYVNHDLGYLAWGFGPEGNPPAVRGVDACFFREGRIAKMYTILLTG
jgi:hypothetical protein